ASNGAYSPKFSSDCSKVTFVTDEYFNADDLNFAPDVYMNTLGSAAAPAVWVSTFASGGADGGGYLPAINADGSKVTFVTDALDVVSSSGAVGGLVVSTIGASSVTAAAYASVKPNGTASSALIDTEYAPAISSDGKCIAFKATSGFDLLPANAGPQEGVFLWDNRGATPVVSLVSKIPSGLAATSATAPRISADCRFIAYESNDDFIAPNNADNNNNKLDVFLYDTVLRTTQLISSNAAGNAADANSSLADLDYDATTGYGVVLVASGASNIRGASGGGADIDLFSVPFTASSSSFSSLSPTRVFDTRQNIGGVGTTKIGDGAGNGTPLEFTITNKGGLPGSASTIGAVSLNVTVVDGQVGDEGGFVTVYPCGTRPDVSNLNFTNGRTVPNAVIAPVSAQGKVCFYVYGKAHLIADVNGYFTQ
ncbi:MAG: hypothetical protein EBX95_12270, partial [Acidimicrobiia bacterium]|nr:hypothetical protein [Acidimicrobiia bacterium]